VERVVDLTDVVACGRSDCSPPSARQLTEGVIELSLVGFELDEWRLT
jgi:hypothetical protein